MRSHRNTSLHVWQGYFSFSSNEPFMHTCGISHLPLNAGREEQEAAFHWQQRQSHVRFLGLVNTFIHTFNCHLRVILFLKILFIERRRDGEREGEKHHMWLPLMHPLLGIWPTTQACAPDRELNQRPFGLQASTQSTEPHQPGHVRVILMLHLC